jgi:hypothetical protein
VGSVDFEAASSTVGGEEGCVVLQVCSAFVEETDVVGEKDVVEAESSRRCLPAFRVLPGCDQPFVTFEGDSASSVSSWSVAPCNEDAGFVDDVEGWCEGVSLEDPNKASQLRSDFSNLEDDVDFGVHRLEESDEFVGDSEFCEPLPEQ